MWWWRSNLHIVLIFLVVSLYLSSCKDKNSAVNVLKKGLDEIKLSSFLSSRAIILMPNSGCSGCITEGENFLMENINEYPDIKVIFTATTSQKSLKLKVGHEVYYHENTFIDKKSVFYQGELISIYPAIFYVENEEIAKVAYQSPDDPDAFEDLKEYLDRRKL